MAKQFDLIARRRSLVRQLYYRGKKPAEIALELERAELFPDMQKWTTKLLTVNRDIKIILVEDIERFRAVQDDNEIALREYINRQMQVYQLAVARNDYPSALSASRDIAKANGIEVERPIKQEEDLLTIMRNASLAAAKKKELAEQPKEDQVVLPPTMQNVTEAELIPNGKVH